MTTKNEPPFSEMLDWLEGRLSEEEAQQITQKLESADEATRADLAWLRSFMEVSATARAISPPPEVRTDLMAQFREYAQTKRVPSIIQRLFATLTFDSNMHFAVSGVRSAATEGKQRQLIYDTDLVEIALNIQPHPQKEDMTLIGQIFPKGDFSAEGFTIQLVDADGNSEKELATSDELGEFTVESLSQGQYGIIITTEGFEIVLPNVPLRQ